MDQLAWRGLIKNLYVSSSYRMCCECDNKKEKKKPGSIIAHIKNFHSVTDKEGEDRTYVNMEKVLVYLKIWYDDLWQTNIHSRITIFFGMPWLPVRVVFENKLNVINQM